MGNAVDPTVTFERRGSQLFDLHGMLIICQPRYHVRHAPSRACRLFSVEVPDMLEVDCDSRSQRIVEAIINGLRVSRELLI